MITITKPNLKWVDVERVRFAIREERFEDVAQSIRAGDATDWVFSARMFMSRISDWEGIEFPDGTFAPCNDLTKSVLFGKRPDLLNKINEAYEKLLEESLKNSGPSQNGIENPDHPKE